MPSPANTNKDAVLKSLSNSSDYCSTVIPTLTEEQLNKYRNQGIKLPSYIF
jgi:hypothetical protein